MAATTAAGDEVKPYKIHVSSKYLDLTRQKLEITRLPHEPLEPNAEDWWAPKPQIEPLIDFWLEEYNWREQEDLLNAQLPQFRTGITVAPSETPLRIHFVHIRSTHAHAIPLLLIPPFPFSNLTFQHLVKPLTEPEDATQDQPFHLVIPALPGVGFSDALPSNTDVIATTTEILNTLMTRLSYDFYLVTNAGSGTSSPAEIDYQVANHLATHYADSCLGTHLIAPPLTQPRLQEAPIEWAKWSIASLLRAPILGYQSEDFSALRRTGYVRPSSSSSSSSSKGKKKKSLLTPAQLGLNQLGALRDPNTLAYALCDSPTGLLVFVLKSLRLLGPGKDFTPTEIINFTQLAWLPGPEAAMRFWAHCAEHSAQPEEEKKKKKKITQRPRIGITVFLGDDEAAPDPPNEGGEGDLEMAILPKESATEVYTCPSWANARYNVVYTSRCSGKPGLLAWERPEIIIAGARGLVAAVLKQDPRLRAAAAEPPPLAPLEQVVVADVVDTDTAAMTAPAETAEAPAVPDPALLAPPPPKIGGGERGLPHREISGDTAVGSNENILSGKKSPGSPASPSPALLTPSTGGREGAPAAPGRVTSDDTVVGG
ncbi:alpha/beta-hydrolase [Xylariomycetidae sp. FL2044]|nr:alpha/beta-hydrolase [Xylariomycetidae sp. FL2044]